MRNEVEERFFNYYEKWVSKLEEYIQQHIGASRETCTESDYVATVAKLTTHHKEYYTTKWAAGHEDVLPFFSPVWLSPLENAYLWITGWKPSMVFRLLQSLRENRLTRLSPSLAGMTEEQVRKIEELRVKIRMEEEKVERLMERQQVAMADRRMVELARLASRVKNGDPGWAEIEGLVEVALKNLLAGHEKVMKMADCARLKTLKGVLDVLTPEQSVDFLTAISMLQIQLRKWGKKRDERRHGN